ncbi:MAG: FoF1 ATP synthase subunit a [Patescibacteria group bacterium]|jgi:F-type H+-transporting ATPase subunit a
MVSSETQINTVNLSEVVGETAGEPVAETGTELSGETQGEIIHENTLFAEPIAHIGSFPVTNSLMTSGLALIIILVLALAIKRKIKTVPTGLQNAMEMIIEGFLGIFDGVTGSRKKSLKFAPLVLAFFFFVLINNWMGILPGVGSIGQVALMHGEKVFIPYLRGGTADLNTTLALATIGVVVSHILGIIAIGAWKYFNKFINIKAFLEIPKKVLKDPTILLVNPIKAFVGVIEIIGEVAKIASLSFRLFGNVFAGEVLLASMAAILAFGVPIPFLFLEVLVGLIQALIFAMLILTYLTINTTAEEH